MKHETFKNMSQQDLHTELLQATEKLRSLQFNLKLGKVQDTTTIGKTKRMIARILTALQIHYGEKA